MMIGTGFMELLIVVFALFSIGLPVAVLVLLFLIFRKLQGIEEKLSKP
jgi:Mn2+/Fe2+ NRAMP family transporter